MVATSGVWLGLGQVGARSDRPHMGYRHSDSWATTHCFLGIFAEI